MLNFSKKSMFAIEAVLDVAYNSNKRPVIGSAINRRRGVSLRYMEKTLQELVHAGILEGVRGPRGGYRLGRERKNITLAEIDKAVKGSEGKRNPLEYPAISPLAKQVVRTLLTDLEARWIHDIERITVEDLFRRANKTRIPPSDETGPDA